MKRSIIITLAMIAAIAVPLCASSGWARGLGVLGLGGSGAASAPTPAFSSNYEDSTDRAQWTTTGTVDLAYSSSGLDMAGSYVARMDTGAQITRAVTSSHKGTLIVKWRLADAPESTEQIMRFLNSSDTAFCTLQISTPLASPYATDGTLFQGITGQTRIDPNSSVFLRLTYEASDGSNNGKCTASKWNGSAWVSGTALIATSAKTDNIAKIRIVNFQDGSGVEYQYNDTVRYFTSITDVDPTTL